MATLAKRLRGGSLNFEIQWYIGRQRKTIPLGKKFTEKTAKELLEVVRALLHYEANGIEVPGKKTAFWIESASDEIRAKLSKAGLIDTPTEHALGELWDAFLGQKKDIKANTRDTYDLAKDRFLGPSSRMKLSPTSTGTVWPGGKNPSRKPLPPRQRPNRSLAQKQSLIGPLKAAGSRKARWTALGAGRLSTRRMT